MLASIDAELFSGNIVPVTGLEKLPLNPASRRLLLLAARGAWDAAQRAQAERLVPEVVDWEAFCSVATRALGVCFALRHLSGLDGVPQRSLDQMRQASRSLVMRSLRMESATLGFMSDCLAPLGVRHVFFKGASLAHRYHCVPDARPSRDVDVLIDPALAVETVRRAFQFGYTPKVEISSDRDLVAWVKRGAVCGMVSPNGVLIEIHQSLDHGAGLLDVESMLSRAESIDFRGRALSVLRTSDLFVYLCMHHTRHFWSHLHWYADLDAMTSHPFFDLDEVREVAAGARLTTTIEACLGLNAFTRMGNWPENLSAIDGPVSALLLRSIDCLEGGLEREYALRSYRLSEDRAFAWQVTSAERVALFFYRVRRLFHRIADGVTRRALALFKRATDVAR